MKAWKAGIYSGLGVLVGACLILLYAYQYVGSESGWMLGAFLSMVAYTLGALGLLIISVSAATRVYQHIKNKE